MMIPGRILVIDDIREEVDKVVDSLRQEGENVTYTSAVPDDRYLGNVRLLITDLYLVENDKEQSYETLASVFDKISKKTTFFVIAIWTKYARNTEDDKRILEDLRKVYKDRTGTDLKAAFLDPFGKDISQAELVSRIKSLVTSRADCGLLFEIERVIENARDLTVTDMLNAESIPTILRALRKETGDAGLGRQMVELFLKILARHSKANDAMDPYILSLVGTEQNIDPEKYGQIYGLQSYYEVGPEECIWTGDLLKKDDNYAVVISPACDFAQSSNRPFEEMKIVRGIRIDQKNLTNENQKDDIAGKLRLEQRTSGACINAILKGKVLQKRFYVLNFLRDVSNNTLFHLVLDFHQVATLPFTANGSVLEHDTGWSRICRIDDPLIDDLLHEYSTHSSRVGRRSIPEDIAERMKQSVGENDAAAQSG